MKMHSIVYITLLVLLLIACVLLLCGCSLAGEGEMKSYEYSITEDIESIDVSVKKTNFSLTVRYEDTDKATLELVYSDKAAAAYSLVDGKLSISAERKSPLVLYDNGENKIIITLPKNDYESLAVDSTSGDITLEKISFSKDVKIDATSSDVRLTDIHANSFSCNLTSGDLTADRLTVDGNLSFESTSGNMDLRQARAAALNADCSSGCVSITDSSFISLSLEHTSGDTVLRGVYVNESSSFKVTSGNVHIENSLLGSFTFDSTSGDLTVKRSDAYELTISSTSGDVNLTLLTPKNFVAKTTSGNVDVIGTVYTEPLCKIDTVSGSITVRIAE